MKLEEGMYARIDGKIGKVVQICKCEQCEARGYYEPIIEYVHREKDYVSIYWRDNLKASHNIIDLIGVGDYVNGLKVMKNSRGLFVENYYVDGSGCNISNLNIKSIVTKEQFSAMEYKVSEE